MYSKIPYYRLMGVVVALSRSRSWIALMLFTCAAMENSLVFRASKDCGEQFCFGWLLSAKRTRFLYITIYNISFVAVAPHHGWFYTAVMSDCWPRGFCIRIRMQTFATRSRTQSRAQMCHADSLQIRAHVLKY